jgi:ribonuclease HII
MVNDLFGRYLFTQMLSPFLHPHLNEAGVDEAGRGCYAGAVFAAAVILPNNFFHPLLNDSKKLSEKNRNILRSIIETESIAFAVASVSNIQIDKINILQATYQAMHLAIAKLNSTPNFLLIDGNQFKTYTNIPHQCIVKGDGKYASIAAASILAKTYRDEYIKKLHCQFPEYDWANNKGYGTPSHIAAIKKYGLCKHHRKSYNI